MIDGSSTVAPISEAIAEEFRNEQPGVEVTVGTSGTGGGFKKFCAGETDISTPPGPSTTRRRQACEARGIEFTSSGSASTGWPWSPRPRTSSWNA